MKDINSKKSKEDSKWDWMDCLMIKKMKLEVTIVQPFHSITENALQMHIMSLNQNKRKVFHLENKNLERNVIKTMRTKTSKQGKMINITKEE